MAPSSQADDSPLLEQLKGIMGPPYRKPLGIVLFFLPGQDDEKWRWHGVIRGTWGGNYRPVMPDLRRQPPPAGPSPHFVIASAEAVARYDCIADAVRDNYSFVIVDGDLQAAQNSSPIAVIRIRWQTGPKQFLDRVFDPRLEHVSGDGYSLPELFPTWIGYLRECHPGFLSLPRGASPRGP